MAPKSANSFEISCLGMVSQRQVIQNFSNQ